MRDAPAAANVEDEAHFLQTKNTLQLRETGVQNEYVSVNGNVGSCAAPVLLCICVREREKMLQKTEENAAKR